ncbi:hypothetical protein [Stomatobaculum longum]|uniref:hypothetical protein n=1 Tax=Stomatobaculum longum TaxID=796942 RepID=UPI0028E4655A|nr:hypothetical protein [Stomatobaculum longum]
MDKHELNVKVEQMRKQAGLGDYQTAMKIADKIDWRRVSNVSLLTQVSEIYEKNEKYREAKDILLLAVERTPMGRGLLFKLTQLALKVGSIDEAEECFEEFQKLAPQDSRQKLLRYQILKAKGAQPQQLIPPLEEYVNEEISEEWMYELAELYHKAGMRDACLDLCDRITILFGSGEWVQKALRLKAEGEGEPLNEYQQSIAGEIYYQPASSPRQNAVRETAPVTPAFSQSVPVIPEFSLQPQEAVPPVMTAPETVPPFTAAPETVPPLTAAPVAAPQYTESVPYGNTAVREAAVPQPAVAMPQYVGGVAAGIAPQPMAAQTAPETPAAPNPAQAMTEQYAAAQEDRYRNVPTFQTATAATTGVPSWTEAVQPQEAPAQNDIDAEIDAHLRRLEEEKLGRRAAATVSQPQNAAPMQVATESMQTAAAAGAGSVPPLENAAVTESAPLADPRTVEQRYREESSRPSREYVVSTEQRAADSEFPGTEQLMVDRLRYEEESAAARARAAARAGEIEEELRSREAKLDETKVLPKLPGQERREQLAREEAELRRLEQDKEAELIQKPAGKTEETAAVDEETPVKAGESAETAAAVEAAELAAAPAKQVAEKADAKTAEETAEAAAGKPEAAVNAVAEAAATEENAATPATERAVSPAKEPLAEEAAAAEPRPKQPKLLRTPGSFNALIEGRTPEEGLQGAVERLKEAQAVTGFKRPAAKVKAERLNVYGVRNSAEKTAGRDLIIEEAGDLSDVSLSELIQLIAADGGMRTVLLIDNPLQLTRLRASHPEVEKVFHTADKREDVKAYFAAEAKYREAEARRQEEVTKSALEAKEARRKEEEARRREEEALAAAAAKEAAERERAEAEKKAAEAEREKLAKARENNVAQAVSAAAAPAASVVKEETVQVRTAPQTRAEDRERPEAVGAAQATEAAQAATRQARTHAEELAKLEADKKRLYENEPMTKDAFANYAAVYARNIDCVITGKSMNALYERIELLQADNVKLTRKNAETLIEEAADRAEKPPLSRRLGGLFSKRYNKDGLLILKEEDFLG